MTSASRNAGYAMVAAIVSWLVTMQCAAAHPAAQVSAEAQVAPAPGGGKELARITAVEVERLRMAYYGEYTSITREQAQIGFCVMYASLSKELKQEALERIRRTKESLMFAAHSESGATPLVMAAQMGDVELVQALLDKKVPVDGVIAPEADWMPKGQTPLMAAAAGAVYTVPEYSPPGVYNPYHPPGTRDQRPFFPSAETRLHVIQLLLKAGANARLKNSAGLNALMQVLALEQADDKTMKLRGQIALALLAAGVGANGIMPPPAGQFVPEAGRRQTLLSTAIQHGLPELAQAMLARGADPKAEYAVAFFAAMEAGQNALARALLAKGINPNTYSPSYKRIALAPAIWHGQTDVVLALLQAGANPNACPFGEGSGACLPDVASGQNVTPPTLLMMAVAAQDTDMVRALLAHGASRKPNMPGAPSILWQVLLKYQIPGMAVCAAGTANCPRPQGTGQGRLDMVRLVLEAGEDANEKWNGKTPLAYAADDDRLIVLLLDHGARAEETVLPDGTHVGPLTTALLGKRYFLAGELLRRGKGDLAREEPAALHLAAAANRDDLVKGLLLHGLPVDERGARGETALHIAADHGNVAIVRMLLAAGAAHDAQMQPVTGSRVSHVLGAARDRDIYMPEPPERDMTPLMLAAYRGHTEVVRALLKAGANRELKSANGNTALSFAQTMLKKPVIALLWDGRPGDKPPKPAVRLTDQKSGQPIGDAWIVSQKNSGTYAQSNCIETHATRTDNAGAIPESWWPEYMGRVGYVYKPGLPVTGVVQHQPNGLTYAALDERMLGEDAKLDAASARIIQINWTAGLITCPAASMEQRKELFPVYQAMIAEAYALARQSEQYSDAKKICDAFYYASLEHPLASLPVIGADPRKTAFLRAAAPLCLEQHGSTPPKRH